MVKVELSVPELRQALESFTQNRLKAMDSLVQDVRGSVSTVLNQVLNAEMTVFLGQPDQSGNKRNGYSERDYVVKGLGVIRIRVPVDRRRQFESQIVPKHERIDPRLVEDMAALHLAGLSTRTMSLMSERLLGVKISHEKVSSSLPTLGQEALQWLKRPLNRKYWALIIDGTYFNVRRLGSVEKEAALIVLGIDKDNRRSVLAIEPGTRDNAESWRAVFRELKERGLSAEGVEIGVMDGLPGLERVFSEEFPSAVTARCWFHAMQNALAKTPKRLTDAFHVLAKRVMNAEGYDDARAQFAALKAQLEAECPRAVACPEKDLSSLLSHYKFPAKLWRALRTTNAVELIHKEFKRRAKAMEAMGENTLMTVVAFTAMKLEFGWQQRSVDTFESKKIGRKRLEAGNDDQTLA